MDSLLKTFENWVTTKIDERLALTGYTRSDELIAKDKELGLLQRDCLDIVDKRIDAIDDCLDLLDGRVEVHAKHLTENTEAMDSINTGFKVWAKHFNDNANDADKRVDDHAKHLTANTNAVESLENRFEDLEQQCSEAITSFENFDINDHVDFTESVTYEIEQLDLTDYINNDSIAAEIADLLSISISAQLERKS